MASSIRGGAASERNERSKLLPQGEVEAVLVVAEDAGGGGGRGGGGVEGGVLGAEEAEDAISVEEVRPVAPTM